MAKKDTNLTYYEAIGRRRTAVARVRLYLTKKPAKINAAAQKGEIFVNDMPIDQYFPTEAYKQLYMQPFNVTETAGRFLVSITARGGGKHGQVEAVALGISRALELVNEGNRAKLKPEGLLTRDSRGRERRKPGTGGRARRQKQSPKR